MARPPIPAVTRQRLDDALHRIRALLPSGWSIRVANRSGEGGVLRVTSDRDDGDLAVFVRERLEPRDVPRLQQVEGPSVVASRWISPRTAELLRDRGIGYVDATGNAEMRMTTPGFYVHTVGLARDPQPKATGAPGLRGPRAWALLRTIIEVEPPYGGRDLSTALHLDAGYVSRILRVLEDELAIERQPRGSVTRVDWEGVLRQLVTTYSVFDANGTSSWVAPGGPDQLLRDLKRRRAGRWVVTGSFAAAAIAPIAAPETAILYADDPEQVAKAGRLLPATTGANVLLAVPYDPIAFDRIRRIDGVPHVSVAQVAADSLTGNGRMPEEGEAVVRWMQRNPKRWRATSLATSTKNAA